MSFRGRSIHIVAYAVILAISTFYMAFVNQSAYAAQITNRSLTLLAGATDGGSKAGGVVNHLFSFTLPGGSNVGSIQFLYCTTASGTCTTPTGLVTTAATLANETGATGFTLNNTTNGAPYLTRAAASVGANLAVTYQLNTVTNPTTVNQAFFVRIATFSSIDTTGASTDTGTVTASTATQIVLTGVMPESLIFCTGATIGVNAGGIPDCTTATPGAVSFNQLFSPTDTATATSQMSASTNSTFGYAITVNGPTLTSGAITIPAMTTAALGTRGTSQFGMNLKANTTLTSTVAVGSEVAPLPNGVDLKGQAAAGYNTVDNFKYVSGSNIANSDNGGAGPTNAQIFTSSYIVNVAGSQLAGTYTTTLTYICTPTF